MDLPLFFISDIHLMLRPQGNETTKQDKLFRFLDHVVASGGTLFIVGDLFDFWFEYQYMIPKLYFPFLAKLFQVRQSGIAVHYLLGNHDYWVRDFITDTLMTSTYADDASFTIGDKRFYVTHGDGLLIWDRAYRLLKRLLRNRLFIWSYSLLHPTLGYWIADWISRRGRHYTHSDEYNQRIVDNLLLFANEKFTEGFDFVITGHYHQMREVTEPAGKMIILGDWINYYSYAEFDGNEVILKTWE